MPYSPGRTSARPHVPSLPRIPRSVVLPRSEQGSATVSHLGLGLVESTSAVLVTNSLSETLDSANPLSTTLSSIHSATNVDDDSHTLEQKYKIVLHQRDVALRGFRALQELQAREKLAAKSPHMQCEELEKTRGLLETACTEREESLAQQRALRRQLSAAEGRRNSMQGDLDVVRQQLKATCAERDELRATQRECDRREDKSRNEILQIREQLRSTQGDLDVKIIEGETYRTELEVLRAQPNLGGAPVQRTAGTAVEMRETPSPRNLDDNLMNELEASLEAMKEGTSQYQAVLARIPDLEAQLHTLQSERDELIGWKQEAMVLQKNVAERESEAVEWERRYEARGVRLTVAVRELNALRARVGW